MRKRPIDDSGNVRAFAGVAGKGALLCVFAALAAAIFLAALFCGGNGGRDAWAAVTLPQNVIPTTKRGLPPEDNWQLTARKANVLFVLDVGSPMTFTATGTMPEYDEKTGKFLDVVDPPTKARAAEMLKQATYGHGGLPVSGNTTNQSPRVRYGREGLDLADEDNNMTPEDTLLSNHLNNYYSPDSDNPYKLVFRDTKSEWWKTGPQGADFGKDDLVPNDSRMYKMKLVMWRVLSDVVLLENLRVGMATTFQELNGTQLSYRDDIYTYTAWYSADFYKDTPFGVNNAAYPEFIYGTGPGWATSLVDSDGYGNAASGYWGIDREFYDERLYSHNSTEWKLLNRAYLRVPIADYDSEGHMNKFKLWLDGYENVTVTANNAIAPYYFENPELFADGKTYLSTAIYPGHRDLKRDKLLDTSDKAGTQGIVFSHRTEPTIASLSDRYPKTEESFKAGNGVGNYFKAGSGEALGTLLDFFSPPVNGIGGVTKDAQNVRMAPANSFPIRDKCEKNWVVIFTAGDDSGDDSPRYTSASAVKDLYEFTRDNDVTKLKAAGTGDRDNTFEDVRLDDGVRTLVVGFVDPESTAANVVALRDKLNAMAQAGDPLPDGSPNPNAKAYFANDTEGLINALRAVLARINSDIQPAPGPTTESPAMGDEDGDAEDENFNLFEASYRVVLYDQWMGSFTRYEAKKAGDQLEKNKLWELDEDLMNKDSPRGSRKIYYWEGGAFKPLNYTTPGSSGAEDEYDIFADMTGITDAFVSGMDRSNLQGKTFDKLHPSRNLINWLHGYDYSYIGGNEVKRKSMLADFGQSTSALAGPPSSADNPIEGYKAWALTQQGVKTRLYAQTNDGILHVIDPAKNIDAAANREQMAILPPPSLLPLRLARLKMTPANNGMLRWIDARDFSTFQDADIPISSIPSYVLDGPVQLSRFDIAGAGSNWQSILIAMLGRAGNGLYTMDVSKPDDPKFYWYYETLENSDGSLTLVRMKNSDAEPVPLTVSPDWGKIHESPNSYPLYQLGFNSPKPKAGIAKQPNAGGYRNMIVVPGGVQRSLDLGGNGRMGAALYILNPDVSKHTGYSGNPDAPGGPWATDQDSGWAAVFNGGSIADGWMVGSAASGPDPYMGMMVSVPTLAASQSNRYVTSQIYASDNRGSIFMLPLEDSEGNGVSFRSAKLRTVATLRADEDGPTDSYASPHGLAIGRIGDDIWLAGGTANVPSGPGNGADVAYNQINADAALENKIKNKFQMIYAFKLPDLQSGHTSYRESWFEIDSADLTSKAGPDSPGWYRKLDPVSQGYGEEYVTVQPEIFDGHIFYATYLKEPTNTEDNGLCGDSNLSGKSRIYTLDMRTGAGDYWQDGPYIEIDGAMVTGAYVSKEGGTETYVVRLGVTNREKYARNPNAWNMRNGKGRFRRSNRGDGNNEEGDTDGGGGGFGGNFPAATTFINYWMIK